MNTRSLARTWLSLLLVAPASSAQVTKLSSAMVEARAGSVREVQLDSSGQVAVYLADRDRDVDNELYCVPVDRSSAPLRLNPPLAGSVRSFQLAAGGARVIYRADRLENGPIELFSVPTDASAAPVLLSPPMVAGGNLFASEGASSFVISPDGERIAFVADALEDERYELFLVPVDGSAPAVRLNAPLVAGGDVPPWGPEDGQLQFTADGTRVLYVADALLDERFELFSVTCDGSTPPVLVSRVAPTGGNVVDFRLTPDGTRVLYLANRNGGAPQLYSAPSDGSLAPVRLSPFAAGVAYDYAVAADGASVYFRVGMPAGDALHRAAVAGGSASQRLSAADVGPVSTFALSPDGLSVAYAAARGALSDRSDLYVVPSSGGVSVRVNGPLEADDFKLAEARFTHDSLRVIYRADALVDGQQELFSVPADGSALPVRLSPALAGTYTNDFVLSATRAIFRTVPGTLHSAPLDGSSAALQLDDSELGATVLLHAPGPDLALYLRFGSHHQYELLSVPADGNHAPLLLNDPFTGSPAGDVNSYVTRADGRWVVYTANQDEVDRFELFAVPSDGSEPAHRLHPPLDVPTDSPSFSPDGEWVLFRADQRLYRAPLDASTPPVLLSGSLAVDFRLPPAHSPDGTRVVFLELLGGLLSAPVDGLSSPTSLTPGISEVSAFRFTSDSTCVVFSSGLLYSVPADGTLAPRDLTAGVGVGPVDRFVLAPDSDRVVYRRQLASGHFELFRAPVDGSLPPVALDACNVEVDFGFLDAETLLFKADRDQSGSRRLFRLPFSGGEPLELNGPLIAGGSVFDYVTTPDALRVVYRAAARQAGLFELFSAPLDGSRVAEQLSGPLIPLGDVHRFALAAAGERVVYSADDLVDQRLELHAAPVDGSSASSRLFSMPDWADLERGVFVPGPRLETVVFVVDGDQDERFELYAVPLAGGRPLKLNDPLPPGGDVLTDITVLRQRVLFRADQDLDGVVELYTRRLGRGAYPRREPR